ncbi:hypothetical protein RHGRI_033114 [Rhododendron griersonianum]|uniref:3-hydroxyisobutyrate dehydrogenase-like NAD-binding domain-containing protein n=1 Tax=Rhododendron griersonianum TaxID=479676 RepID=A0AAV6HY43_9ERIC|nr:hypothetical protein RHGRI_033114 [Rhododendron griersonianum]
MSRFVLGDMGNGAAMKLVLNMIVGSMMASFSEGLLLGEKIGPDPNVLIEDLRLALGLAESVSQPTPNAVAANKLYKVAKSRCLSDEDSSSIKLRRSERYHFPSFVR